MCVTRGQRGPSRSSFEAGLALARRVSHRACASRQTWAPPRPLRASSRLSVDGLRCKAEAMLRRDIPCNFIAASAMRSSARICWNLLVIGAPCWRGMASHFRSEAAVSIQQGPRTQGQDACSYVLQRLCSVPSHPPTSPQDTLPRHQAPPVERCDENFVGSMVPISLALNLEPPRSLDDQIE